MDDDLTHKLCDIIKCNNILKEKINQNDIDVLKEKVSELSEVTVSKYCNSFVIQEK